MSLNKLISIASWNCRGLRGKFPEIQANDYIYDLWCLQETMVIENTYLHSNIFNFVRGDICRPGQRGVAIAIRNLSVSTFLTLLILVIIQSSSSVSSFTLKVPPSSLLTYISVVTNSSYGY